MVFILYIYIQKKITLLSSIMLIVLGVASIVQAFYSRRYIKQDMFEVYYQVAFKNWRIDPEYLIFEDSHNCQGLAAQNDSCGTNCCDELFKSSYSSTASNILLLNTAAGVIMIFSIIALVLQTIAHFHR